MASLLVHPLKSAPCNEDATACFWNARARSRFGLQAACRLKRPPPIIGPELEAPGVPREDEQQQAAALQSTAARRVKEMRTFQSAIEQVSVVVAGIPTAAADHGLDRKVSVVVAGIPPRHGVDRKVSRIS